jgi:uncharacterized cupin superfamily protein
MVSEVGRPPSVTHVDADDGWEHDEETGGQVHLVRASEEVTVGLWKPDGTAGARIEYRLDADETLVVLRGSGEVSVDGGEPIQLRPGVVVSLPRGCQLSWLVDDEFRELWVYS